MLSAQKKLLEASVAEQGAQLQSSELTYFENNFGSMNTMASVIGGFAFSGILIPTAYDTDGFLDGNNTWAVDFFYGFASLSVGCCMAAAITCTIVNVRGPGLALRGPDGSLKRAVDGMRKYQKQVLYCLATGVVSFHMEGMLYAWIALHKDSSQIVTTVIFTVFLCAMVAIAITVFYSFNIEGRMVEGMFTEDQFSSAYKQLAGGQSYGAEGETLVEAQNINLSLALLGDVLAALSRNATRPKSQSPRPPEPVPYRNSKLTHLLKDSLGGNSKTLMITNLRAHRDYYRQSLVSLMYASRARKITNATRVNVDSGATANASSCLLYTSPSPRD